MPAHVPGCLAAQLCVPPWHSRGLWTWALGAVCLGNWAGCISGCSFPGEIICKSISSTVTTPSALSRPIRRKQNMFNSSVLLNTEVTVEMVCRGDGSGEVTSPPASPAWSCSALCSWNTGNLFVPPKRALLAAVVGGSHRSRFFSASHLPFPHPGSSSPCSSCHVSRKSQGISWSCSCMDCGGPGSSVVVTSQDFLWDTGSN